MRFLRIIITALAFTVLVPTCFGVGIAFTAYTSNLVAATTIDFEDLPVNSTISKKYVSKGVEFSTAFIDISPQPHSGTKMAHHLQGEFSSSPMTFQFLSEQSHVQFFGGSAQLNTIQRGTARAYDAGGNVIAQDGPKEMVAG